MGDKCEKCDEWLFGIGTHRCHPAWRVWCPEYEGDDPENGSVIYAFDEAAAVEAWAEEVDENYTMIDSPETVKVMPEPEFPRCREWKTFVVSGEATIDFHAEQQEEGDP